MIDWVGCTHLFAAHPVCCTSLLHMLFALHALYRYPLPFTDIGWGRAGRRSEMVLALDVLCGDSVPLVAAEAQALRSRLGLHPLACPTTPSPPIPQDAVSSLPWSHSV